MLSAPFRYVSRRLLAPVLAAILPLAPGGAGAGDRPVTVFAAASLGDAVAEVAGLWQASGGAPVVVSAAGSPLLARQIMLGAPADVFISANAAWMDRLEAEGLIQPETRRNLAGNLLALVRHGPPAAPPAGDPCALLNGSGSARVAMALVSAVPAGIYGKAGLTALGCWERVSPRVAQAGDVRAALALVVRGGADFGVVYATDAKAEPAVHVAAWFPEDSHPRIVYPAALVARDGRADARAFLDFLASPEALAVLRRHGFIVAE